MSQPFIHTKIYSQLQALRRFAPDVNRLYADLVQAYYTTQATRLGISEEALYRQYPLTVDSPRSAPQNGFSHALSQAVQMGYAGADIREAFGWLDAKVRGLDMSKDARLARAREQGFDTETVWYHGTAVQHEFDQFIPGGPAGVERNGNVYGEGVYFTRSHHIASVYAREWGQIIPTYHAGAFFQVDDQVLTDRDADRIGEWINKNLFDSDRAKIAVDIGLPRKQFRTADAEDAREYLRVQRDNWAYFGDGISRTMPELSMDADQYVIEYTDFSAPLSLRGVTREGLYNGLFRVGPWAVTAALKAAEYDGLDTGGENPQRVVFNPSRCVRSIHASFDPNDQGAAHLLAQFAGPSALTADKAMFNTAQNMLPDGVDPEDVRRETGWHRDPLDGNWRFEITEARQHLSEEERRQVPPASTRDIPDDQIIVRWNNRPVRSAAIETAFRQAGRQDQTASPQFRHWFGNSRAVDEQGRPLVLYHGTGADFTQFKGFSVWGAADVSLANEYAGLRSGMGGIPNVMPIYLRAETPFDADRLPKTITVGSFFNEALKQAKEAGRNIDLERGQELLQRIRSAARVEESGPHYSRHDLWNKPAMLFGLAGAEAVREMFELLGFDSVTYTEMGVKTFGVFSPEQVKSAIGNRGTYDPNDPNILHQSASSETGQKPTETEAFRKWFGNSKVVDGQGQPLVVYHGTSDGGFAVFDQRAAKDSDANQNAGDGGLGFFFTDDKALAEQHRDRLDGERPSWMSANKDVYAVYLSLKNPFVTSNNVPSDQREELERQGYDGVIYDFGGWKEYVAFHPEQIKSATDNCGRFNPDSANIYDQEHEANPPRGLFDTNRLAVVLLEGADLSTFIHESAHFFLEVTTRLAGQPDTPAAIKQDMQTLLNWFGLPDLDAWKNCSGEKKVSCHEMFAEGFERYMLEGKAPTQELQPMFDTFRNWLVGIYKGIVTFLKGHPNAGGLNDEIRGVMGRMIAMDAEAVKQARVRNTFDQVSSHLGQIQANRSVQPDFRINRTADQDDPEPELGSVALK